MLGITYPVLSIVEEAVVIRNWEGIGLPWGVLEVW